VIFVRRISGHSMMPTLKAGKIVFAFKSGQYFKDDIVLFSHDGLDKIKRIANVSSDNVFVLGDNMNHSTDSRVFGSINKSDIKGKVIWPLNKIKEYR